MPRKLKRYAIEMNWGKTLICEVHAYNEDSALKKAENLIGVDDRTTCYNDTKIHKMRDK